MKISIVIMAHPSRRKQAERLLVELTAYPFIKCYITWDEQNSEWHTGKRALQAGIGKADWHVVIQDDAILTPDFYHNVEQMICSLGQKTLISLYTGTSRPFPERIKTAVDNAVDGSFLRFHQLLWGVGVAIPSDHIAPMLEFVEDIELQYDNKIGEFYCRQGMPVYYCIPSLVDHDDDIDTLLPGHGRHISPERRVAHRLATGPVSWTAKERYI